MPIQNKVIRLDEFESQDILPLTVLTPETYQTPLLIQGNSLLSSVYVKSMDAGATLLVNYWDYSAGDRENERYDLSSHILITPSLLDPLKGYTNRLTVTRAHNKPVMEAIVSGGNVQFGVFITVVTAFASDLDAALQREGELVNFARDKGMPIMAYDEADLSFHMVRTRNGKMLVDAGVQEFTPQPITTRKYGILENAAGSNTFSPVIEYTVPVGKKFVWIAGMGTANTDAAWRVSINGQPMLGRRNSMIAPDVYLGLSNVVELNAGETLTVDVRSRSVWGTQGTIESWIYGRELDV